MKRAWVLLFALCVGPVGAQGIYKWVDENGDVHYGEAPPNKKGAAELSVKTGPAAGVTVTNDERMERQRRILQDMETERVKRRDQEKEEAEKTAKRNRDCAYARDRVRRYQEAGMLYNLDEKGERRVLTEEERTNAHSRAEAEVAKWCK